MSRRQKRASGVALRRAVLGGLGLVAALPASAQEAAEDALELIPGSVTGSQIPTTQIVGATPVDVFTSQEIARTGSQTVAELLQKIPAYTGSTINLSESTGNGGDGRSTVDLRGIAGGTLVLINGRRVNSSGWSTSSSVDVNTIPLSAVKRVEVLKDGASAIYGTDAVAGVVNIILKEDFTGIELHGFYGNTTDQDLGTQNYSFTTGFANEKTSLLVGGSYFESNAQYSVDREITYPSASQTSPASNPGRFQVRNDARGSGTLYDNTRAPDELVRVTLNQSAVPDASGRFNPTQFHINGTTPGEQRHPDDRFPFAFYTTEIRPAERYSFFGNVKQKLYGENLEFFTDAMYSRSDSYYQLAPAPITSDSTGLTIPADNYYNPFGVAIDNFDFRPLEQGVRPVTTTFDFFRFVPGFRGRVGESTWNWEVAAVYSETRSDETEGGSFDTPLVADALARTDPTAFNMFGRQGVSETGAATLTEAEAFLNTRGTGTLWSVDGKANGELTGLPSLPGGPLQLALGASFTKETGELDPDLAKRNGQGIGFNAAKPFEGEREITGGWAELLIPIVGGDQGVPFAHSLSVSAAGRYDDYSDLSSDDQPGLKPKFTLRWEPLSESGLVIRGSYGESFRAPTFAQLYFEGDDFPEVRNPYTDAFEQIPTVILGSVPGVTQYPGLVAPLKPEESRNYTAGAVWDIPGVRGLSVSLDWFRIETENTIGASAQSIIDLNASTGGPSNRLPGGGAGVNPSPGVHADLITFDAVNDEYSGVIVPYVNLAASNQEGVDVALSYNLPTESLGVFDFLWSGTYYLTYEQETVRGAGFTDYLGDFSSDDFGFGALPRLRFYTSVFWDLENIVNGLELGAALRYTGGYNDDPLATPSGTPEPVDEYWQIDLQAGYDFTGNTPYGWLDDTRIAVGVLNVTDEPAPRVYGALEGNTAKNMYDVRQRFVYASLTKKF